MRKEKKRESWYRKENRNEFIIHSLKNTAGIFLVLGLVGFIGGTAIKGIDFIFSVIPGWLALSLVQRVVVGSIVLITMGVTLTIFSKKISFKENLEKVPVLGTVITLFSVMQDILKNAKPAFLELEPGSRRYSLVFTNGSTIQNPFDGEQELVHCYYPNSPIPATGFVLYVPSDQLKKTNLTNSEALARVMTGGFYKKGD